MPDRTVRGVKLHYEERGDATEAVVFAHGLLMSGEMYAAQVEALSDRYRCIAFDFRGHGGSEVAAGGYDMDSLADDAIALIEALDAAPCHFAGHSMGGFVGMRVALRRPDLLHSLILLSTSAEPEPRAALPGYRRLRLIARLFGLRPVVDRVIRILFGRTFLSDPGRAAELREVRARIIANDRIGATRAVRAVLERDGVEDRIHEITVPTLIVVGDEDVATPPARSRGIHERIAGSRLVVLPGVGHTPTIEAAQTLDRTIAEFLGTVGTASTDS